MQYDKYGFGYYDTLPDEAIRCDNVWEFVTIDPTEWAYYRVNIGQQYFIYNKNRDVYEPYRINSYTRDYQLDRYIKQGRLFFIPL
jgi:hypothetical protein